MEFPSVRDLLRRTGIALLAATALSLLLHLGLVLRIFPLGGLGGDHLVPWYASWDPRVSIWTVGTLIVAAAVVHRAPRILRSSTTPRFMIRSMVAFLALAVAIALSDGAKDGERREGIVSANGVTAPFERTAHEYIGDVPKVDEHGVTGLLRGWSTPAVQERLAWHSRTHPPGPVLFLHGVAELFGRGALPAALAVLVFGALSAIPAWGFARIWLAESPARAATLLYLLAPNTLLFSATSMEPVFAFLALSALTLLTASLRHPRVRTGRGLAPAAGAVLAIATFFTWATLLVVVTVAAIEAVAAAREPGRIPESLRRIGLQFVGFAAVVGGLALLGWDPIAAVRVSLAADSFAVGGTTGVLAWLATGTANLTAWGLGVGLATLAMAWSAGRAAALGTIRVPIATAAAIAVLLFGAFSTLFTLEVERIWIFLDLPALVGIFALLHAELARRRAAGTGTGSRAPWERRAFVRGWTGLLVAQTVVIELLAETRW